VKTILSQRTVERETATKRVPNDQSTPDEVHALGHSRLEHESTIAITAFMVRCETPSSNPSDIG
jgi:hypothetical protein